MLDASSGGVLADIGLGHTSYLTHLLRAFQEPSRNLPRRIGHTSYLTPHAVTSQTAFNLRDISKLFVAAAVLRLIEEGGGDGTGGTGGLSLASEIGPSRASLEQVLSHTSGHWTLVPNCVGTFAELCDEERTPAAVAAEPPLLVGCGRRGAQVAV